MNYCMAKEQEMGSIIFNKDIRDKIIKIFFPAFLVEAEAGVGDLILEICLEEVVEVVEVKDSRDRILEVEEMDLEVVEDLKMMILDNNIRSKLLKTLLRIVMF